MPVSLPGRRRADDRSEVRVRAPGGIDRPLVGRLVAVDESAITISRERPLSDFTIPKDAITRLEVRRGKGHGGRRGPLGLMVGVALGAGAGMALCRDDGWAGVCAVVFAPLGGFMGMSAGVQSTQGRWHTVPAAGWHIAAVSVAF